MTARELTFSDALSEGTCLAMERDPSVFLMGVGVDDPGGTFGTTREPFLKFGPSRVFDTPISENTLTGMAVGAALAGSRPILVHARNDFLLLTLDQLANHAAKWSYMAGGARSVPLLVRAIIGRGWGQAAQHSQSLQAVCAHFPGLEVIMPSCPADAKGMILSALTGHAPVICIEHRWSYGVRGPVAEGFVTEPIGKVRLIRSGTDVTVVAISQMVAEATTAAATLAKEGVSCEVLDLRTVRPWDVEGVLTSVSKTGRLVVADTGWSHFGVTTEISAIVGERLFGRLKAPVARVALPDVPTPCAPNLEAAYYPGAADIVKAAKATLGMGAHEARREGLDGRDHQKPFTGAF